MNKLSIFALALFALFLAMPVQADDTPGWYVGAGVGGIITPDAMGHTESGDTRIEYNPGWSALGSGGYEWNNGWRLEGEVYHSRADVDKVDGPGGSTGHLSNTDLFANALYDFRTGTRFTPYIGAGAGVAFATANNIGVLVNGGALNDTQTQFAYQAIAGVSTQLDDNWAVTADYRYVASLEPDYATTVGGSARSENASHNLILGVRYSFGQPSPPVRTAELPQPKSTPMAKPVVAEVPQSYMVFFDFDQSKLTPEAERILASAAQEFKKGGFVKIVVTGHTDTVGTIAYNQKLSERRAAIVKAALVKLGVDAKMIKAVGAGKNGLLVPSNDQVREAQNRRAEIVFNSGQ
jgi:OmpA-OmpF porin, OOP family